MIEFILGNKLDVTCKDGTTHQNVIFKVINNMPMYETLQGVNLKAETQVITIDGGELFGDILEITYYLNKYKKENEL
jgi:hypothetical protein